LCPKSKAITQQGRKEQDCNNDVALEESARRKYHSHAV
jgi:hypothetical protein